jgi:hypothetical protein
MTGTTTSEGVFVGFVSADHYERLAERKRLAREERRRLDKENRLRVANGLEPLLGQSVLPGFDDDAPAVEKQRKLF